MARTYPDAVTAGTHIKGSHVRELRGYIQEDLNAASISFTWGWDLWSQQDDRNTRILAIHFTKMRDAIQALWNFKGRGDLPDWTQEAPRGPSTGAPDASIIRATHVTDLRRWLNQYENNHAPRQQGIDSKSYDPADGRLPIIVDTPNQSPTWDWPWDIHELTHDPVYGPLYVRTVIRCPGSPIGSNYPSNSDISNFNSAFERYALRSIKVYALLTIDFYRSPGQSIRDALVNNTNPYIDGFSNRLEQISQFFSNVTGYIIWNEPNARDTNGERDEPENFASLLYHCRNKLDQDIPMYWGGIQFGPNTDENALQYIDDVYRWFVDTGISSQLGFSWPWQGLNIYLHGNDRSSNEVRDIFVDIRDKQDQRNNICEIIVGEWGVFIDDPDSLASAYNKIWPNNPDIMFFFSHFGVQVPVISSKYWGLRAYMVGGPIEDGKFKLLSKTALFSIYDSLIGS